MEGEATPTNCPLKTNHAQKKINDNLRIISFVHMLWPSVDLTFHKLWQIQCNYAVWCSPTPTHPLGCVRSIPFREVNDSFPLASYECGMDTRSWCPRKKTKKRKREETTTCLKAWWHKDEIIVFDIHAFCLSSRPSLRVASCNIAVSTSAL